MSVERCVDEVAWARMPALFTSRSTAGCRSRMRAAVAATAARSATSQSSNSASISAASAPELVLAAGDQHAVPALARKQPGSGLADPRRGSGDDGDPSPWRGGAHPAPPVRRSSWPGRRGSRDGTAAELRHQPRSDAEEESRGAVREPRHDDLATAALERPDDRLRDPLGLHDDVAQEDGARAAPAGGIRRSGRSPAGSSAPRFRSRARTPAASAKRRAARAWRPCRPLRGRRRPCPRPTMTLTMCVPLRPELVAGRGAVPVSARPRRGS